MNTPTKDKKRLDDRDHTPSADPDGLEDLDTEAVEDLDAHEHASQVVGGYFTTSMSS